jgi:DNA helicase-2/ATP-dependent DNA helicase PcrA
MRIFNRTIINNLNPLQLEAVLCTKGPLIIFAGAGTGKTRVITYRIAHLLSLGITPWSILAVTFTNKASEEMKKRVIDLIPQTGKNVYISTFHSFCAYFLSTEAERINLNPNFLIYNFSDQKNIIKECLSELNIDNKKFKISTIIDKINRAKDSLKMPYDMVVKFENKDNLLDTMMFKIYRLYQKKILKAGALDFGDLIMQTVLILQRYPKLLNQYQEKYKYIMVDEYQDTNHAQYMLIKLLSERYKNICVVGDDDQSVYSWRGADINNILNFKKDYPKAKFIKLEQNYRSTPKILLTAHKVVKNNNNRINKQLWTQNIDDGSVEILKSEDENDEAAKIVNLILLNMNGKYNLSDFAVFYRTNAQSRSFEDTFRRLKIPYTIIGALRFYDRTEIKDIIAYLKFIHNPSDNISFKRIINTPKRGIGKTSLKILEKLAINNGMSLWQTIPFVTTCSNTKLTKRTIISLNFFKQFMNTLIELKNDIYVKEITEKVIIRSKYLKELEAENTFESHIKIENIKELISATSNFEKHSLNKSLASYLTQIALIDDMDSLDDSNEKVTLMTLHLAKGLEFNNVFICGLEEGLFPIGESTFDIEKLEEERRLMYVGMTRAKKHLYLSWSTERTIYGKTKWNVPSRFISESGFK